MRKRVGLAIVAVAIALSFGIIAWTQTRAQAAGGAFEKREYNFNPRTKGRYSEMITVVNPGKMITLAGVDATKVGDGKKAFAPDLLGQCRYAFVKIKKMLATQGANLGDVTRMVTYVTDMTPYDEWVKCRTEAFGAGPLPASTIMQVSRLQPDMKIEVDVDAVTR